MIVNFYFTSELCIFFSIVVLKNILLCCSRTSMLQKMCIQLILLYLVSQKSIMEMAPINKENVTSVGRSQCFFNVVMPAVCPTIITATI